MQLDWKNLGFQFLPTHGHAQCDFADGKWGPLEFKADPVLKLHVAANALHYGQAIFEGLKAFRTKDDKVVLNSPETEKALLWRRFFSRRASSRCKGTSTSCPRTGRARAYTCAPC